MCLLLCPLISTNSQVLNSLGLFWLVPIPFLVTLTHHATLVVSHQGDPDAPFLEGGKSITCARPCAHGRCYGRRGELMGFRSRRCSEHTTLNSLSDRISNLLWSASREAPSRCRHPPTSPHSLIFLVIYLLLPLSRLFQEIPNSSHCSTARPPVLSSV